MPSAETRTRLEAIHAKAIAGERIDAAEALDLLRHEKLTTLLPRGC